MKTADAIKHFGNANRLAKALGIDRSAVSQWGDTVPRLRQFELEILTNGQLRAERPQQRAA